MLEGLISTAGLDSQWKWDSSMYWVSCLVLPERCSAKAPVFMELQAHLIGAQKWHSNRMFPREVLWKFPLRAGVDQITHIHHCMESYCLIEKLPADAGVCWSLSNERGSWRVGVRPQSCLTRFSVLCKLCWSRFTSLERFCLCLFLRVPQCTFLCSLLFDFWYQNTQQTFSFAGRARQYEGKRHNLFASS